MDQRWNGPSSSTPSARSPPPRTPRRWPARSPGFGRSSRRRRHPQGMVREERFDGELAEGDRPEVEVVLLWAESRAALEKTHARYFHSVEELAAGAL
jgi:hypothetical protein